MEHGTRGDTRCGWFLSSRRENGRCTKEEWRLVSNRSTLEVILDFISKPLVLIVVVLLGGAAVGASGEVERLVGVVADAIAKMKPW